MKKIIILAVVILTTFFAFGQTTTPSVNNEYCPLINNTFSVSIPLVKSGSTTTLVVAAGIPTIVTGITGLSSSSTTTSFTFVGRFSDDNIT
jgi:hypothetical protein